MSSSFDSRSNRIGLFIMAYDAESHLAQTLERIPADIWEAITCAYLIDDCSKDDTVDRALKLGETYSKLKIIRNRVNRRYGGAQKVGYQYAMDAGLDVVVMLHADGQYAPEYLADILGPLVHDEADVVFGSRMMEKGRALEGGMPRYKYVGNRVLTTIENALCGTRFSEFHSGYRGYRVEMLKQIPLWENSDEWHFDTEILLQAVAYSGRIREVPIPTYYGDEISHVNGVLYGVNCIVSAVKYFLHRKKLFYSRVFDLAIEGRKYFDKFHDPYSSHSIIWRRLKSESLGQGKILELGVGDASLTRRLSEAGATVDGIECDALSARLAEPYCRKVYLQDLDQLETFELPEEYDVVIAADVLEHLKEPEYVLSKLKRFLKKGGLLVVSLPNVANFYVRANVLLGRFPYHSKGLLDRTHLHFYTIRTAEKMLDRTGWNIEEKTLTSIPLGILFPFLTKKWFAWCYACFYAMTRLCKGPLAYQSIFFARNPNESGLL